MAYKVFFTIDSKKELDNLIKNERDKTFFKIMRLDFPFPNSLSIKKLSGTVSFFRLKTGKIRIIFMLNFKLKQIIIRKIGFRKDVYRQFKN
ncbi:hypothetical protein B6D29_04960 [Microgenomates bacterium UTCPR1]|nr:MAG: hypothetical protein B6D29_04960 [Microgenomates bacterium UTCPR1]